MGRRYDRGRSGNKLLTNLLRDLFHLRNIQGRDPNKQEKGEMRLMVSIRRDTLDAFWIRELGTFRYTHGHGNYDMVNYYLHHTYSSTVWETK